MVGLPRTSAYQGQLVPSRPMELVGPNHLHSLLGRQNPPLKFFEVIAFSWLSKVSPHLNQLLAGDPGYANQGSQVSLIREVPAQSA